MTTSNNNPFNAEVIAAIRAAKHILVFTGAGVSAESGISTFRDQLTGLWAKFDAADLATPEAFARDQALVWGWYEWRRVQVLRATPNPAHVAIAQLSRHVPKLTVVTQNVDDLHERAGSTDVLHLHGSLHSPRCFVCCKPHLTPQETPADLDGNHRLLPPICVHCGGVIRPGVVWFGEDLPAKTLHHAFAMAQQSDVLFAIGTSGVVYPAAQIPTVAKQAGATVIQVNPHPTELDAACTWSLRGAAGDVMPRLLSAAFNSAW